MSRESRQARRIARKAKWLVKDEKRQAKARAEAAAVRATKREIDIREGREPDPEPTFPDPTRY
jgi:hypothetical protein